MSERDSERDASATPPAHVKRATDDAARDALPIDEMPPARRRGSLAWKAAVPIALLVAGAMFGVSSRAANGTDLRSDTTNLADVVRRADQRVKTKQEDVATLRADVEATDLPLLQFTIAGVSRFDAPGLELWRRMLAVVLEGLRAGATEPLPGRALTDIEFSRAIST